MISGTTIPEGELPGPEVAGQKVLKYPILNWWTLDRA
jgi:hypothetical protein